MSAHNMHASEERRDCLMTIVGAPGQPWTCKRRSLCLQQFLDWPVEWIAEQNDRDDLAAAALDRCYMVLDGFDRKSVYQIRACEDFTELIPVPIRTVDNLSIAVDSCQQLGADPESPPAANDSY